MISDVTELIFKERQRMKIRYERLPARLPKLSYYVNWPVGIKRKGKTTVYSKKYI